MPTDQTGRWWLSTFCCPGHSYQAERHGNESTCEMKRIWCYKRLPENNVPYMQKKHIGDICAGFWTISHQTCATWNWFTTQHRQTVPSHSLVWQQRETVAAGWWMRHAELMERSRRRWCGNRGDLSEALHAPNTDVHHPDLSQKHNVIRI